MAQVIRFNDQQQPVKVTEVKNLGWLLKHWREVQSFAFVSATNPKEWDGLLVAILRDGTIYVTNFASGRLLEQWLGRPVFRGLPISWNGTWLVCGPDV